METDNKVILYTIGCPNCKTLERMLGRKNIKYEIFDDADKMVELGIKSAPMLSVNGELLNFSKALQWVNKYGI